MSNGSVADSCDVTVVGAGIVGICCALWLQRAGCKVTIIDRNEPGRGASFGNAANISPGQVVPYAMPGLLRDVPRWLMSKRSPFKIRPTYLPIVAPWLWAWSKAGQTENAIRVSRAMRVLHSRTFELYEELTRNTPASSLFEKCGHLYLTVQGTKARSPELASLMREAAGVQVEHLSTDDLRLIEPSLAPIFTSALLMPDNGRCKNPYRLVQYLVEEAVRLGARLVRSEVTGVLVSDGQCRSIFIDGVEQTVDRLVVAAGIGSKLLSDQLSTRIPLETERGYHVTIDDPGIMPTRQIIVRDWGIGAGPIEDSLRIAGTVEFCGIGAKPNWIRAERLLERAKQLLPAANISKNTRWVGDRPSISDGLPVLGQSKQLNNVYFAFGNGHHGMTGAPMMGKIISELVTGQTPSINIYHFRPERFDF